MSNDVNRECTGNHVIERVTDRSTDRPTGGSTAIRLRGGKNETSEEAAERGVDQLNAAAAAAVMAYDTVGDNTTSCSCSYG